MKAKRGYLKQKGMWRIGKWLKRYFAKRTCKDEKERNATIDPRYYGLDRRPKL